MQKSLLFFLTFSLSVWAQTDTLKSKLNEITVSANKYETSLFKTASSVTVLTSDDIEKKQSSTIVDLLKEVPGLTISQQGGTGKLSSVFIRGSNSNFVLVMIDNVEVNDPSSSNNAYDFSSLQSSDIERVEIVRGPQSTLYGSDATAGVINIITKTGAGKPSFNINGEGGSNNFYKGSLSASGSLEKLNYYANYSRMESDAISSIKGEGFEEDGYSNNSAFSKIGYNFNEKIDFTASYKFVNTKTDLDQAEKNGDDPNYKSEFESHLINFSLNSNLFNGLWKSSLRGSFFKNKISSSDRVDELRPTTLSEGDFNGNRISFNWQNNLKFINNNLITFGIDSKIDEAKSNFYSEGPWGPFESNFPEKNISTIGAYIQDLLQYNNFTATIGYRFDKNEKYGSVSTFRIAPTYFITQTSTKIKATYGTGFKAPSLFNLYAPLYGNSQLDPEKSSGWDVGFEQFLLNNYLVIGLTYFNMQFEDMLGFDENFVSININEAETKGFEASLQARELYGFNLDIHYTFNETFNVSNNATEDEQLIRRPKNQLAATINYEYKKLGLGLSTIYSGEKFDNDFSVFPTSRVILKGYTIVNFRASYNLLDYLTIYGRIENMFDEEYQDILYYGTLGRAGYLGFNISI